MLVMLSYIYFISGILTNTKFDGFPRFKPITSLTTIHASLCIYIKHIWDSWGYLSLHTGSSRANKKPLQTK